MKVKFGMIVTDGSGKLGGQVMSSNKGGKYIRTKVTPSNPNTVAQQTARAILSSLSTNWAGLSDTQRASWNGAVSGYATTDIFGDIKNPSGFNLYVKLNANLSNAGLTLLVVAPEKIEVPYTGITSAIFDISNTTGVITFDSASYDGEVLFVSATPSVSAGKSNVNSEFRGLGAFPVTAGAIDIYDAYVLKFGVPTAGANISVRLAPIVSTGQKGTNQSIKPTVQA